jgi:hypothetical protein
MIKLFIHIIPLKPRGPYIYYSCTVYSCSACCLQLMTDGTAADCLQPVLVR